jgi:hypothetical protein
MNIAYYISTRVFAVPFINAYGKSYLSCVLYVINSGEIHVCVCVCVCMYVSIKADGKILYHASVLYLFYEKIKYIVI